MLRFAFAASLPKRSIAFSKSVCQGAVDNLWITCGQPVDNFFYNTKIKS